MMEEMVGETCGAGIVDIVVYNSSELPTALYLALSLAVGHRQYIFQSELISNIRILNRRQLQIFSIPNISRASDTSLRSRLLIIHTVTRVN